MERRETGTVRLNLGAVNPQAWKTIFGSWGSRYENAPKEFRNLCEEMQMFSEKSEDRSCEIFSRIRRGAELRARGLNGSGDVTEAIYIPRSGDVIYEVTTYRISTKKRVKRLEDFMEAMIGELEAKQVPALREYGILQ